MLLSNINLHLEDNITSANCILLHVLDNFTVFLRHTQSIQFSNAVHTCQFH